MTDTDIDITPSSGNVFADLGHVEAADKKAKIQLAMAINTEIAARKIGQTEAARLLGTEQPKISALANYKLAGFSLARLMEFLTALDRDVEIVIRPRQGHGHITIRQTEAA